MKKRIFILFLLFFINLMVYSTPVEVKIYTYHTHAPFIVSNGAGLTYDLAEYLSDNSDGDYVFTVIPMSRMRVEKILVQEEEGLVPWVNPSWFQDETEAKYLWSSEAIMKDGNAIISHRDLSFEYAGPESVIGLVFGGVRGHHYIELDEMVSSGRIKRFDADAHLDNFRKLVLGRIDFTITPLTGAKYLIAKNGFEKDLYISRKLHSEYERRFIINHGDRGLRDFLDKMILKAVSDPVWQDILSHYISE